MSPSPFLSLTVSLPRFSLGTNNYSQLQILISQTRRVKSFYHLRLGHYSLLIRALKYANETRSQNEAQINFSINIIIIYYLSDSDCCLSSPPLPPPTPAKLLHFAFAFRRTKMKRRRQRRTAITTTTSLGSWSVDKWATRWPRRM